MMPCTDVRVSMAVVSALLVTRIHSLIMSCMSGTCNDMISVSHVVVGCLTPELDYRVGDIGGSVHFTGQ